MKIRLTASTSRVSDRVAAVRPRTALPLPMPLPQPQPLPLPHAVPLAAPAAVALRQTRINFAAAPYIGLLP